MIQLKIVLYDLPGIMSYRVLITSRGTPGPLVEQEDTYRYGGYVTPAPWVRS